MGATTATVLRWDVGGGGLSHSNDYHRNRNRLSSMTMTLTMNRYVPSQAYSSQRGFDLR